MRVGDPLDGKDPKKILLIGFESVGLCFFWYFEMAL
jgi:hypothetical protein